MLGVEVQNTTTRPNWQVRVKGVKVYAEQSMSKHTGINAHGDKAKKLFKTTLQPGSGTENHLIGPKVP